MVDTSVECECEGTLGSLLRREASEFEGGARREPEEEAEHEAEDELGHNHVTSSVGRRVTQTG